MNVVAKPHYILSSEHKWLLKFKNDKKVIKRLRDRAVKAFEYSILEWNPLNNRIQRVCTEIMERFWAARYPEIVETPNVQIYDLSLRGSFAFPLNKLPLHKIQEMSDVLDFPTIAKNNTIVRITKDCFDALKETQ